MGDDNMIKSMTGYGNAAGTAQAKSIAIEIRSVNSRYFDCSVRLPRIYLFAEELVKKMVGNVTTRGKIDVYKNIDSYKADDMAIEVNRPVARAYLKALREIGTELDIPHQVDALAISALPNVLRVEKLEPDIDVFSQQLTEILTQALRQFDDMRSAEGEKLAEDIEQRLNLIDELISQIARRAPESVVDYKERLNQRIVEMLGDAPVDQTRLITEVAIFADRVAIDEELTRLESHMLQFRQLLTDDSPVGRKLDFLVQELNREVNTIGSKGNDTVISKLVIDLKAEIEKIREQAQNIE